MEFFSYFVKTTQYRAELLRGFSFSSHIAPHRSCLCLLLTVKITVKYDLSQLIASFCTQLWCHLYWFFSNWVNKHAHTKKNNPSQPLPEWEYNGNPDLVGYRVQYSKAGSKGGVLSHVIMDRLEREFTIEDLEEWTEYEVRVQAINGIGSGPWSQPVHGRTRESGEGGNICQHII